MSILGEKGLSVWVKRMLDLIFIGGIGILLSLPYSLKWYFYEIYRVNNESYFFLLGFLYITGVLCLWIVYEIRRIFKTLNRNNPFKMDNVVSLKQMSLAAYLIAAAYVIKMVFFNSFLTIIIAMVFLIAGLFSTVLAEVFRQAVVFKEENDLTI